MSFDTPEENRTFREAEAFPYHLLSDADRSVGAAYGARKPPDEKYADFPRRISYLIGPEGRIAAAYEVFDVSTHADEVLEDLRRLRSRRA